MCDTRFGISTIGTCLQNRKDCQSLYGEFKVSRGNMLEG